MDIDQLRLFVAVARHESMSRAAVEMNITQSAVSQSIARLEGEVGVKLFTREKRGLRLREAGRTFYQRVNNILHELDTACLEVRESENTVSGILRLQVFTASALMPRLLSEFSKLYPEVRYQMIQQDRYTDFDLCITYVSNETPPRNADILLDEEVMLAVPNNHALAIRNVIHLQEVKNENFILMRPGTALRTLTNKACRMAGFEPRVVFESDNPATVREMIAMGLGVSFLPQISWHGAVDQKLHLLHIDVPQCRRRLCIYSPQGKKASAAVTAFRQYAIAYFRQTQQQIMGKELFSTV